MPYTWTRDVFDHDRRNILGFAATTLAIAALGIGANRSAAAQVPANPSGAGTTFRSLKQVSAGVLNMGYAEDGPVDGPVVVLLHGWPYDIYSFVDVVPV